ncbi:hypothetical protein [Neoaquamicrobium sediminum]|uniref:hypothetical protein n=1 Tax=Neoaquamicrobium sediminum TaxID=1849104 RepID=UPI001FD2D2EB|nr:hypothetical protein [Mesorhizobium sediminum]
MPQVICTHDLAAAGRQQEYLEEGVVPMPGNLPIVQVRTLRDRFAVNPEVSGFS